MYPIQAQELLYKLNLETVHNSGSERREFLSKDSKSGTHLWLQGAINLHITLLLRDNKLFMLKSILGREQTVLQQSKFRRRDRKEGSKENRGNEERSNSIETTLPITKK